MSNPQSKLDAWLAEARIDAREASVPAGEAALALARLRSRRPSSGIRGWRRAGWIGAAATVLAIVPILTLSPQSEAAKLMAALNRPIEGVVRQRIYDWQDGRWVWREDLLSDGSKRLSVRSDGGEELFEAGRTLSRDPRGFVTITEANPSTAAVKLPDLEALMKSECFNHVRGRVAGDETLYELSGSFRDGRDMIVRIDAQVKVDGLGRIAREEVRVEPNHHSRIDYVYGLDPGALRLSTKAGEPVYDLVSQQEEVFEAIEAPAPRTNPVRPVGAYVDENGYLAVLVEVPSGSEAPRGEVRLDGREVPAAYLNFNGYGARQGQEMEVPVRYGGRSYLLKSAKVDGEPKAPFRFEFPLWTRTDGIQAQHPFAEGTPGRAWTAKTARLTVPRVQRTSSVIRLLSPRNVPFFLEQKTGGGKARESR